MTGRTPRQVEHRAAVSAPASEVYRLIADVGNWPLIFEPSVYVDYVERGADRERIRMWADVNGEVKSWTSRRLLDAAAGRIEFRQEVSAPPVAAMGGAWVVEPTGPDTCLVRLLHDFRAVGDDQEKLDWIGTAVDRNSRSELAALQRHARRSTSSDALTMTFEDTLRIAAPVEKVYDFVNEAQHWADRLPHVTQVELREETPGVQQLRMATRTKDGSAHSTESVRVCFRNDRIVYKQTVLPALLDLHTGCWRFEPDDGGTVATSRHTAVINENSIPEVLGGQAGITEARDFVRTALGGNSLATLGRARQFAEAGS
ncbi:aromatase/cyclase [Streptomyces chrestomyceticus]|uniref:aromatase/cyclase n=1 Tax=Streptomyces chrestomyceticus TaxID=68185 RepID=UPI0037B03FBF